MLTMAAALTACARSNPTGSDLTPGTRGNLTAITAEVEFASRVATTDPATRTLTFTTSPEIAIAADDAEIVLKNGGADIPITFAEIQIGDSVEVRGDRQSDGTILADRIRVRIGDDEDEDLEFHSVITSINLVDSSFTVRDRTEIILVTGTTRIVGRTSGGGTSMAAHDGDDDDNEGSGRGDRADTTVAFEALVVGDSVEVHALIIDASTLQATVVELEDETDDDPNEIEFKDHLASVDVVSRTVTFDHQPWTGIVDETADLQDLSDMPIGLDGFMAGQFVEVRGSAGTGDTLRITRMHMDNN